MKVLLVTTWGEPCGIAEHSAMLKEAVEAADPDIQVFPNSDLLDPALLDDGRGIDILHLNYQAALHSRWTSAQIAFLRTTGMKVVVTYHDSGVPNSDHCKAIIDAADAAVVHEPFDDLPAEKTHYWRMGVPEAPQRYRLFRASPGHRPVLGTIGFPFGWKNYSALIRGADAAGWNVLLLAPTASKEQIAEWLDCSDHIFVRAQFLPREEAVQWLAGCDATAFTYVTHNTGQSGAILLGIAARKPVFALRTCRQFRALYADPIGRLAIRWIDNFDDLAKELRALPLTGKPDKPTVALAEQESWAHLGKKYAALYRSLV
jgi:hypothetical protein